MLALKAMAAGMIAPIIGDAAQFGAVPTILASMASSGVVIAVIQWWGNRRRASTDRQQVLDAMQVDVLEDARQRLAAMGRERDELKTHIAHLTADLARAMLRNEIHAREIARLHDEIATVRAQVGLGGRRHDDDDPQVP